MYVEYVLKHWRYEMLPPPVDREVRASEGEDAQYEWQYQQPVGDQAGEGWAESWQQAAEGGQQALPWAHGRAAGQSRETTGE